jgi:hypothetical protein
MIRELTKEILVMTEQLDLFEQAYQESLDNNEQQKSCLSPRQWELYRLIKYNSLVEHRKTTQKEICEKIDGYEWNDDEKCHDHCPAIWKDIKDNNESYEHDKIIISKDFCYWIGSQQETKDFLKSLWKSLSPRLKRYWHYVKKVGMDGMGKLFDKNGNQNQLNDFYEVFNSYDISMLEETGEK